MVLEITGFRMDTSEAAKKLYQLLASQVGCASPSMDSG
jgi:hypothetical protein